MTQSSHLFLILWNLWAIWNGWILIQYLNNVSEQLKYYPREWIPDIRCQTTETSFGSDWAYVPHAVAHLQVATEVVIICIAVCWISNLYYLVDSAFQQFGIGSSWHLEHYQAALFCISSNFRQSECHAEGCCSSHVSLFLSTCSFDPYIFIISPFPCLFFRYLHAAETALRLTKCNHQWLKPC